jgi:hypothetical protein
MRAELMDELAAGEPTDELADGEITAKLFAEHTGMKYDRAASTLDRKFHQGLLTRRKMNTGAGLAWAYSKK